MKRFNDIRKTIEEAESYFEENKKNYEQDREFLFNSTLTKRDEDTLSAMGKPAIKINVLESYVSRLIGEWSKQSPMLQVKSTGNNNLVQQEEIVEGYLRSIFSGSDYEFLSDAVYRETMSGGYSVLKVITEYRNPSTFEQVIRIKKPHCPTLCGFDPMARESSKKDARYCYEVIPKSLEEFQEEYPNIDLNGLKFFKSNSGFNWSYNTDDNKKVVNIVDYYEKQNYTETLVLVSNVENPNDPLTMTLQDFETLKQEWVASGRIEAEPIELKRRRVVKCKIVNYKLVEDQFIEKPVDTDYSFLPLVFFDGNSAVLKGKQKTRSYIVNAKGPQRLKNLAISSMVDAFENARNSTVMIANESLPTKTEYQQAWLNPQKAKAALIYNAFDSRMQTQLPAPQYFQSGEINPIYLQLYNNEDKTIQAVLGSYDAQLGIQKNQLSGVAIQEGATQSNNAAMPFVVNYLKSLNQIAKIIVDLIPKYYKTAMTLPIIDKKGDHKFIKINTGEPESDLIYKENDLEVVVKPGVNFEVQKNKAVNTFLEMMKVSETFKGMVEMEALPILLENLDIKGQDKLKLIATQFMQQQKEAKQAAAKMQSQQPNPELILAQAEQIKAQNQQQQIQMRNEIEQMKLMQDRMKIGIEAIKAQGELLLRQQEAETEQQRTDAELAIKQTESTVKIANDLNKQLEDFI